MHFIREWLGFWFLEKALRVLPASESARAGALRGLREQRAYDRYEGYCELRGVSPLPFGRWREVWFTLRAKAAGAEQANAALRGRKLRRVA